MKKKGFTLIELLAVIVVLAIIALIATPIVMNVIKDAQKGAVERSAERYVAAVELAIATEQLENGLIPDGTYRVDADGNLVLGQEEKLTVEVSGDRPKAGSTVTIQNEEVVKDGTNLEFEGYTVTIDNNGSAKATEKGNELSSVICDAIAPTAQQLWTSSGMVTIVTGVQATEEAPYALGSVYSCNLGDGERTFYVLKEDGNNVKLIMNENFDGRVTWCATGSDNSCEADRAKAHLISQTSGWIKLASVGGTVELPDAQDLSSGTIWTRVNMDANAGGYWTSTPDGSGRARYMMYSGAVNSHHVDEAYGVRPVIVVPKSNMSL